MKSGFVRQLAVGFEIGLGCVGVVVVVAATLMRPAFFGGRDLRVPYLASGVVGIAGALVGLALMLRIARTTW